MTGQGIWPNAAKVKLSHIPTYCTPTCKETKSKLIFEFTKSLNVGFNLFCYNQTVFFIVLKKREKKERRKTTRNQFDHWLSIETRNKTKISLNKLTFSGWVSLMLPPSVFIDAGEVLMGTEISGGGVMGGWGEL